MNIKPLRTEVNYRAALKEIESHVGRVEVLEADTVGRKSLD
jgi:hypothetical protein